MPRFRITIRNQDSQKTKNGTYNIKIRITHKGKTRYLGTDYYVTPEQIEEDGTVVHHPNKSHYNIQLRNILNLYEKKILEIGDQVKFMEMATVINHLKGIDQEGRDEDFFFMAERVIYTMKVAGRSSYANSLGYTIDTMKAFSGDSMVFTEITPEYLERFGMDQKLKGNSTNTAAIHFRNIRMIYNKGIDTGKVSLASYPFRRFKIKQAKTRDRDMEADDIRMLRDADLKLVTHKRARDLFMLSFYMCGLNFKDLLYAQKSDIRKDRLIVNRIKTDEPLSIKITPQAREIINRYHGDKFLLYLVEEKLKTAKGDRKSILHKDVISQVNIKLKDIAKDLGIPYKLSTYFARHSWSSIAFNECEVSEEIIGLALGHASPRNVTAGYIRKKYELVDKANEAVIASLNA